MKGADMSEIKKCENCGNENIEIINRFKGHYSCGKCGRDTEKLYEIEHDAEIRARAIEEFAERIKERLVGMQMAELQGEDVCPCAETGKECPHINQDIGCQYCAREQTIKDIDEIAERMKGGVEYDFKGKSKQIET